MNEELKEKIKALSNGQLTNVGKKKNILRETLNQLKY